MGLHLLAAEPPPAGADSGKGRADTAYDDNPQHLWNRLHAAFYQRDVEAIYRTQLFPMGPEILDPPLGMHPRFLLDDEPFARGNAVLDEFLSTHGEKNFADPLKRALLQRDLWAVFELLQEEDDGGLRNFGDTPPPFTPAQQEHRASLSRKLAHAIAALALPRAQLEALAPTYALTVKSGAFPAVAVDQAHADYLPADLFAPDSPWLEATNGDKTFLHVAVVTGRSTFRVFFRPPVDAKGAAKFAEWVREERKVQATTEDPSGEKWTVLTQSLPVGSQFLLLREMVSVDDQWQLVPTHVVESVQVRVFQKAPGPLVNAAEEEVKNGATPYDAAAACQVFEEFELDRRRLFHGESGGLKATPVGAPRHMGYSALGRLAVNRDGLAMPPDAFPKNCFVCHVEDPQRGGGRQVPLGIMTLGQAGKLLPPPWDDTAARAVLRWKVERKEFRRLRELATAPAGP